MRTSLLVCLSSVGFLPCQSMVAPSIGGTLQTTGPFYGNYAIEGTVAMHDGWKAHAVLPAGISSTGAATGNTSATTIVGWHTGPGPSIAASVSEQGSGWALLGAMDVGTTPSPLAVPPDHGEHTLTMIVLGVPDQRGKLETWASGALRGEALATMMVDVGADGTTDFAHQATAAGSFDRRQWDLRLDGAGQLVVAIRTGAKAKAELGGAATYLSALTVRFTAGTFCDMATDGPACGARLTGYDRVVAGGHEVVLETSAAAPSMPGVLVAGTRAANLPLPGTPCQLLVSPLVVLPFTTDARGEATHVLPVPAAARPWELRLQDIVLDGSRLTSSGSVALSCR